MHPHGFPHALALLVLVAAPLVHATTFIKIGGPPGPADDSPACDARATMANWFYGVTAGLWVLTVAVVAYKVAERKKRDETTIPDVARMRDPTKGHGMTVFYHKDSILRVRFACLAIFIFLCVLFASFENCNGNPYYALPLFVFIFFQTLYPVQAVTMDPVDGQLRRDLKFLLRPLSHTFFRLPLSDITLNLTTENGNPIVTATRRSTRLAYLVYKGYQRNPHDALVAQAIMGWFAQYDASNTTSPSPAAPPHATVQVATGPIPSAPLESPLQLPLPLPSAPPAEDEFEPPPPYELIAAPQRCHVCGQLQRLQGGQVHFCQFCGTDLSHGGELRSPPV